MQPVELRSSLDLTKLGCAALALATFLSSGEAAADAPCLLSELQCGFGSPFTSSAPADSVFCSSGSAAYNITTGRIRAGAPSATSSSGQVTMSDSFQVIGPVAGTPLDFTAQLIIVGSANGVGCGRPGGSGGATGRIVERASNVDQVTFATSCGFLPANGTIQVPVHCLAGERFQLSARLSASGVEGGSAFVSASLHFSDLPPGAAVVSCGGFEQTPPVTTHGGSWGRVKTHYR